MAESVSQEREINPELSRVTAVYADESGCGWYRVMLPYGALSVLRGNSVETSGALWRHSTGLMQHRADVVVIQRPSASAHLEMIAIARLNGAAVVIEIDDLLWGIPTDNPARPGWEDKRRPLRSYRVADEGGVPVVKMRDEERIVSSVEVLKEAIRQADAVTASTPPLRAEIRNLWPQKPVYVLPNCEPTLDWNMVNLRTRWEGTGQVVIGWVGSSTHKGDLDTIRGLFDEIEREVPYARFYAVGYEQAVGVLGGSRDKWTFAPWVDQANRKGVMGDLTGGCEIALAVVKPNRFNDCKSDLKALEANCCGIPVVATAGKTYEPYVQHGVNGLLCEKPKHWFKHVRRLLTDHELRYRMGVDARKEADKRDIDLHIDKWAGAMAETVERRRREHPEDLLRRDALERHAIDVIKVEQAAKERLRALATEAGT